MATTALLRSVGLPVIVWIFIFTNDEGYDGIVRGNCVSSEEIEIENRSIRVFHA
jgi:hypothetical protein